MNQALFHSLLALWARERQRQSRAPLATRLETSRLIMRPHAVDDAATWIAMRRISAPALIPYEPQWPPHALTPDFFYGQWRRQVRRWVQDREYTFAVCSKGQGGLPPAVLGGVSINELRRNVMQSATLGYWMGTPHVGKGYMREALQAIIPFAFDVLGLHRLDASCLPDNTRSLALLRGLGFREIGLSQSYMQIEGVWRDHLLFERLA